MTSRRFESAWIVAAKTAADATRARTSSAR